MYTSLHVIYLFYCFHCIYVLCVCSVSCMKFEKKKPKTLIDPNAPGAPLGESLWKLPNRRFSPDYYVSIKKPISMAQIRNKLKRSEYSNITEMTADLYTMLDNAKKAFPDTHKTHKVIYF